MSDNRIRKNKYVTFNYRILDVNQQVVEQSDIPMEYLHGVDGKMFEKVEQAMEGKNSGDQVKVTLSPDEGFGHPKPELTYTDSIDNVPPEFRQTGARPMFQNDQGETIEMVVTKIEDGKITIDGNHPFAGKNITFVIDIVSVQDTPSASMDNATFVSPDPDKLH
jgi:FKBP-type peptidyl-prolyl cis-trans isomerase SlyD